MTLSLTNAVILVRSMDEGIEGDNQGGRARTDFSLAWLEAA